MHWVDKSNRDELRYVLLDYNGIWLGSILRGDYSDTFCCILGHPGAMQNFSRLDEAKRFVETSAMEDILCVG